MRASSKVKKAIRFLRFSPGVLLLELGEPGIRGDGPGQFNEPSDLAIGPDGTLYIVDGHIIRIQTGESCT